MHHVDTWTPKLAGERLIEAIRWARYNAGPTGPASVRALYPIYVATPDEREEEGWGEQENANDPTEVPKYRRPLKPHEVSALIDALYWPAKYAVEQLPTATRVLNVWLRCKVYGGNFDKVIETRREFSRATAYRYRDKALAAIAVGLESDGVPLP